MRIGAQFFTIRDFCKTTEDLEASIKKVADIGYKFIQLSGVCDYDATWMRGVLDKYGLECVITHIKPEILQNDLEKCINDHKILKCKYIGLGSYGFNSDERTVDGFIKEYEDIAVKIKENDCFFMYHNHDVEYKKVNGKTIMQDMADRIPQDLMGFTLDAFWVQAGGADPAEWLEKLSGRVPCIHVKDYGFGRTMLAIGEGNLNMKRIVDSAIKAGCEYLLVEQDECNGEDPFKCLEVSYKNLCAMGLD